MRMDTNTNGHRQWFYFSVKNLAKTTVRFNIYRFKKQYSLFQRGMKPYVRSKKGKNYWHPAGTRIFYKKQKQATQYGVQKCKNTYYLTFQYKFQFQNDEIFFAAGIPYTYTFMLSQIENYIKLVPERPIRIKKTQLCKSMCGLNIPMLNIQPFEEQEKKKNFIIINTRTHAGETSCSWVLEGILEKISQSQNLWNWINKNNIYLKIIPMLNPDGVFMGNYRTGIIGDDFNRKFLSGKKQFFPEINGLKKLVNQCKKNGNVQLFLDLHGHSILKNSFIYGPIDELFSEYPLKGLPISLWHSSKYFRYSSCKFKFEKQLNETARVFFQIKESILTFTCQNSLGLFSDHAQTFQMLESDYKAFGASLIENMSELLTLEKIKILDEEKKKKIEMQKQKIDLDICKSTTNADNKKKGHMRNKNMFNSTTKNVYSPQKKFPIIDSKSSKNDIEIKPPSKTSSNNEPSEKEIQKKLKPKDDKFESKMMNQTMTAKEGKRMRDEEIKFQKILKNDLQKKDFENTGGIFPKKIQQFEKKKKELKEMKFKIRRKSDAIKFVPETIKKKDDEANYRKKFSSSKYIHDNDDKFSMERSSTFDEAYLSENIQKMEEENYKSEGELSDQDDELSIIDEQFSENYESINDEDSESDNLSEREKNYILEYIRNNRKLKTTQNDESQEEQPEDEKQNPQISNVNAFKEIRFKSIEEKLEKSIPSLKPPKREPHKFREFTHKSLGKDWREDDGIIQMIHMKKLNERFNPKKNRDPYMLIQKKNKHF